MTRQMNTTKLVVNAISGLVAIGAIVAIAIALSGGSSYTVKLRMSDASGLRPGSLVNVGGVQVGTVSSMALGQGDQVVATLSLNPKNVRVGRGASAVITAANLLGEEYVQLSPGDRNAPVPSGTTLPESATTLPTDLDQIVDVLNGSTRARLETLLTEAGEAMAGRQGDISATLKVLPPSVQTATTLLTHLVHDNDTLAQLIQNSNQFITTVNAQAPALKETIDTAAGTAETLARRAGELRSVIGQAPGTLVTLQGFLQRASHTAVALRPAAGQLADSAQPLQQLLTATKPFSAAAVPTLNQAADIAPQLTTLATQATPTVSASLPMLSSLDRIASLAKPLSTWLGLSGPDLVQVLAGWSHAIAERDGISHIFGGDVMLNPLVILDAADTGANPAQKRANLLDVLNPVLLKTMGLLGAARAARAQQQQPSSHPASSGVGALLGAVGKTVHGLLPGQNQGHHGTKPGSSPTAGSGGQGASTGLGAVTGAINKAVGTTSPTGVALGKLLDFLLK